MAESGPFIIAKSNIAEKKGGIVKKKITAKPVKNIRKKNNFKKK